jgi:hypothetical protein
MHLYRLQIKCDSKKKNLLGSDAVKSAVVLIFSVVEEVVQK